MSETVGGKQKKGGRLLVGIVLLAGVGGGTWYWKSRADSAVTYDEVKIGRGDLELSILATGTVQPENRLEIKPPIAGRVDQVLVKEGQQVRKGQVLAWMSSTERAALLDAARSKSGEEVKRWEELYRPTPVIAPISGMIILRNIESGQTFSSTDSILVMSDRLTVKAQVDETDIAQIKLKQAATIVLDAYSGQKFSARVDQIAFDAKTVSNVTTYVVDVLPDEPPEYLRSGMTANVSFVIDSREGVVLVPNEAIKASEGSAEGREGRGGGASGGRGGKPAAAAKSLVLVRGEKGEPVEKEVKLGLTDGKRSEVLSGLAEGDIVLSARLKAKERRAGGTNPFAPPGPGGRPGGGGGGRR